MIKLLQNLEPRFYHPKEYILEQGEEVNEQIYVTQGSYSIGFEIRNQKYYHVKLHHKTVIGSYENMFGRESEFYYKALNTIEGYGLRKKRMKPIMDKFPDFKTQITSYSVNFYYKIIRQPMLNFKKEILIEVGLRQDMDKIVKNIDKEIIDSEQRFNKEFNQSFGEESSNQDAIEKSVRRLESKVNKLAKAVHGMLIEFDEE